MEALSPQMTMKKNEAFSGLFTFSNSSASVRLSNLSASANNIGLSDGMPATVGTVTVTGDSTNGNGILSDQNATTGTIWFDPANSWPSTTIPYPTITIYPTFIPSESVIIEPTFVPFDPIGVQPELPIPADQLTEGLIRRLEDLLERAKRQQAAAATPQAPAQPEPKEEEVEDAEIDTARFKRIEKSAL